MFGFFKKKAPAAQDAKPQQPNEALLAIAQQSLSNAMQSNETQAIAEAQAQAEIQAEALADEDLAQQALAAAAEEATDIQANASNADRSAPEQPSQTEPAGTLTIRIHRIASPVHDRTITLLLVDLTVPHYRHPETGQIIFRPDRNA